MSASLSPFTVRNSPADTIGRCVDVLAYLAQEDPLEVLSGERERGRVWIVLGLADALRSLLPDAAEGAPC